MYVRSSSQARVVRLDKGKARTLVFVHTFSMLKYVMMRLSQTSSRITTMVSLRTSWRNRFSISFAVPVSFMASCTEAAKAFRMQITKCRL